MDPLIFNKDRSFTIIQFTDLHWENGDEKDRQTKRLMEEILKVENPDLVVFTGDTIYGPNCNDPKYAFRKLLEPVVNHGTPWAAVFGNHDSEESMAKEDLLAIMQEFPNSLVEAGNVSGLGNYALPVLSANEGRAEWILYFLDSGMDNLNKQVGGYDFIKRDQIDWYVQQSSSFRKNHSLLPSELLFFHIPLPEYKEVWQSGKCVGSMNEGEICSPSVNSGLFSAMVEMGAAKGTFVGHDHLNDFCGEWHGIQLCYGRATGYNGYGEEDFLRGARVIKLQEGKQEFETYLRLADGSKISQENKVKR